MTAGWGCGQDSDQHGAAAAVCSPCTSVLGHRLECNPPVWDPLRLVTACLGLSASSGLPHSPAVPVTRGTLTETGGHPALTPKGLLRSLSGATGMVCACPGHGAEEDSLTLVPSEAF